MIKRMLIYYGFLYHDYGIPIKQYVLYIGKKSEAKMPTSIKHENLDFQFNLINILDLDHNDFLYSNRPEDVIIAILCDFKEKSAERILETILIRLKLLSVDDLALGKYLKQLEILSNLRNLQELTIKKLSNMSFIYDLETDIRYQQGFEKGKRASELELEKREKEAELERENFAKQIQATLERLEIEANEHEKREKEIQLELEKREKEAKLIKESMLKKLLETEVLTIEYIASITDTTVEFVKGIKAELIREKENNLNSNEK